MTVCMGKRLIIEPSARNIFVATGFNPLLHEAQ